MDPAKIALQRRISSDSVDSVGVAHHPRSIRKGRRKTGTKRIPKRTKVTELKGDDLRCPPSPHSDYPRHSDRAPDKRALRDDVANEGKKRTQKTMELRRTRSLSPQTNDRRSGTTELLRWNSVELLGAAGQGGLPNIGQRGKVRIVDQENKESDESSLGSLIDAIESEFGGHQELSVYHQSTSSLPAVPIYSSDENEDAWSGNEKQFRFSPDADVLLSMASATGRVRGNETDTSGSTKSLRKTSMSKDANNASMGTLSTEASTLSSSLGDAIIDLFAALKPSSSHDRPDPPSVGLDPPSLQDPEDPPGGGGKVQDRSLKKKKQLRKTDTGSLTSNNSQWLELVLDTDPTAHSRSTVGEVKAYKETSGGTVDSMNSEEVKKHMEEIAGKSLSALDVKEFLTPTRKRDFLHATTHCSPRQVSKHANLSSLSASAHTSSSSNPGSGSSAYLLERLPLEPPITSKTLKQNKISQFSLKIGEKGSALSVDKSIVEFQPPQNSIEGGKFHADSNVGDVSPTTKSLRRSKKPEKTSSNVIAATLAIMSSDIPEGEMITKGKKRSDESSNSVVVFSSMPSPKGAIYGSSASYMAPLSSDESGTPSTVVDSGLSALPTAASTAEVSSADGVDSQAQSDVSESSTSTSLAALASFPMPGSMYLQNGHDAWERKNPPARPWGRNSNPDSLTSTIEELSCHGEVEEDSMLSVLINSIKKEQQPPDETGRESEDLLFKPGEKQQPAAPKEFAETRDVSPSPVDTDMPKSDSQKPEISKNDGQESTSPNSCKKDNRKVKNAKSVTQNPASDPEKEAQQAETAETVCQEPPPIANREVLHKTPKRPTSPTRSSRIDDGNNISAPPLTTPRPKTPNRLRKSTTSGIEQSPNLSDNSSPRRRVRARKPSVGSGDGSASSVNPTKVRQTIGDGAGANRKKTPTRIRSEDGAKSVGRRTPNRLRPGTEDIIASIGKKTPTRARPGTEDNIASGGKRTPTRARPGTEGNIASGGKKTPNRARLGIEGNSSSGGKNTPTRVRPGAEDNIASGGKKTPTRVRPGTGDKIAAGGKKTPTRARPSTTDEGSDTKGKRTPTRTRPAAEDGAAPPRKRTPTQLRPGLESEIQNVDAPRSPKMKRRSVSRVEVQDIAAPETPTTQRQYVDSGSGEIKATDVEPPRTPSRTRGPVSPDSRRKASPLRVRRKVDTKRDEQEFPSAAPLAVNLAESTAPDPPALVLGNNPPRIPDPPADTKPTVDSPRISTPARVRRMFDAAADRIVSACKTPPRGRNAPVSVTEAEGKLARGRSFSPLSRLRLLTSRSSSSERLRDESDDEPRRSRKRTVSQSPPRSLERLARNLSGSLSPLPLEPQAAEESKSTSQEPASVAPQRPTSRLRRRPSSSDLKTVEEKKEEKSSSQMPTRALEDATSSRTRTPSRRRRKNGEAARETSVAESGLTANATTKTKTITPSRIRRGSRNNGSENGDKANSEEAPIGKVSTRPRRRGTDPSSGVNLTDKAAPTVVFQTNGESPPDTRRKTPTRGRPTTVRPHTPSKTRKILPKQASERRFHAPDAPGDNRSKVRSQSAGRRRSLSQTRLRRSGSRLTPVTTQCVDESHPLSEFFD